MPKIARPINLKIPVCSYQRKRSLSADGIVGTNTWKWLCNDSCKVRPTLRYQSGYSSTGTAYLRPFVKYVQRKVRRRLVCVYRQSGMSCMPHMHAHAASGPLPAACTP